MQMQRDDGGAHASVDDQQTKDKDARGRTSQDEDREHGQPAACRRMLDVCSMLPTQSKAAECARMVRRQHT